MQFIWQIAHAVRDSCNTYHVLQGGFFAHGCFWQKGKTFWAQWMIEECATVLYCTVYTPLAVQYCGYNTIGNFPPTPRGE